MGEEDVQRARSMECLGNGYESKPESSSEQKTGLLYWVYQEFLLPDRYSERYRVASSWSWHVPLYIRSPAVQYIAKRSVCIIGWLSHAWPAFACLDFCQRTAGEQPGSSYKDAERCHSSSDTPPQIYRAISAPQIRMECKQLLSALDIYVFFNKRNIYESILVSTTVIGGPYSTRSVLGKLGIDTTTEKLETLNWLSSYVVGAEGHFVTPIARVSLGRIQQGS